MAKRRSLEEDVDALKKKVKDATAQSEDLKGKVAGRSLKKRLKRVQRKIQVAKKREADRAAKTASTKE